MGEKNSGKTMKVIFGLLCLVVVAGILLLVWNIAMPKGEAGQKQIVVEVVHADGGTKDFTLQTEEAYLGGALVEGGVVVDDQGEYGLFIQTVDGETANTANQEWWKVTKDGEMVNTGADATPIADGEHYELTLTVGYDS